MPLWKWNSVYVLTCLHTLRCVSVAYRSEMSYQHMMNMISSPCNPCSPANHHSWWCCRTEEFFLYEAWCSSLLAFSDWRDLACDKGFLQQDTMKSLLIRRLSLASFTNLCTNLESPTWTSGPRKTAQCVLRHAVEVYRAILKICNFIIFQNYRGKVEIITEALKNSKG